MGSNIAVGMAALANSKKDPGLMVLARAKYGSSLRLIANALRSPAESSKENTIAAVFLMSMFEVGYYLTALLVCLTS